MRLFRGTGTRARVAALATSAPPEARQAQGRPWQPPNAAALNAPALIDSPLR